MNVGGEMIYMTLIYLLLKSRIVDGSAFGFMSRLSQLVMLGERCGWDSDVGGCRK